MDYSYSFLLQQFILIEIHVIVILKINYSDIVLVTIKIKDILGFINMVVMCTIVNLVEI
jgi:hypothetical protein